MASESSTGTRASSTCMTERGDCQRLATGDSLADPKELLNSILLIRAKGKDDPCRTILIPGLLSCAACSPHPGSAKTWVLMAPRSEDSAGAAAGCDSPRRVATVGEDRLALGDEVFNDWRDVQAWRSLRQAASRTHRGIRCGRIEGARVEGFPNTEMRFRGRENLNPPD